MDNNKNIEEIKEVYEKIENIQIKDIINIFYSNNPETIFFRNNCFYINSQSEEAKTLGLSKDLCNKLCGIKSYAFFKIKYNEEDIPGFFKIVEIEDSNGEKERYYIYRYQYCEKLINEEKKFKNPFIIVGQKIFDFSQLKYIFLGTTEKFKIIDKEIINYKNIFEKKEVINVNNITGLCYSENFNYYFKYPNKNEIFIYNYSPNREKLLQMGKEEKIRGICGNFGIGKSTSLLASKLEFPEIIYFNIKALIQNQLNIFVWKYELLLKEIAYSLKYTSNYETFEKLQTKIKDKIYVWESIIEIVKFTIENHIKTTIILDQYKELYDKDNANIKDIIDLINKDSFNNVKLIISSSINNKDVRNSLLKTWFPIYNQNILLLFEYNYFDNLFDSKSIVDNDKKLSHIQRTYINDYFNNIPRFYYDIKNIEDKELEVYKNKQKEKIFDKINSFYKKDNELSYDDYEILLNYRQKIGKQLEYEELFNLLRILPLKYFTLKDNIINFYFPLVEIAFDEFLETAICSLLRGPLNGLNDGFIGDMLEYILLNDLKSNKFDNFDDVIKVETIWNLKIGKKVNITNIENKDILIVQSEPKAKYLDFGILSKSNILILVQCKKALAKKPDDYITSTIINNENQTIFNNFKTHFNANIQKIYLLYITGISFDYDQEAKKHILKPWGNKESETFKVNEEICKKGQCKLIYYNPLEKRFYLKIDENEVNLIKSLVNFSTTLKEINVTNLDDLEDENFNLCLLDNSITYQDNLKKIKKINKNNKKLDFFGQNDIALLTHNKIPVKAQTYAINDSPEFEDIFKYNNICIGFKRKSSKIFTYSEKGKKRKIYEIKKSNIKEKTVKELLNKNDKYDKFYYMLLETK